MPTGVYTAQSGRTFSSAVKLVWEVRILDVLPRLSANRKYEGRASGSTMPLLGGGHHGDLLTKPKRREVVTIYEIDCSQGMVDCAHAVYNFRWTPQRDPNGVLYTTIDYLCIPVDRSSIIEPRCAEEREDPHAATLWRYCRGPD